ncbi:LytR/AlgR family response regulator transcription factor [Alistipes sp.]|uniref:LytR/AlgR family response regulator transcription factor n=1 Tax=Alistipes sp. TaxID=1872444 RepID=UPI003A83C8C2
MIKCLAIDDEPLALRQLRTYIARVPFLELAGEFRNAIEASQALGKLSVDLIFCDINMPDLSGIDFVRSLPAERRPMIVFTTAHSEYAVEGFRLEAVDYLLKPFGFDDFNRAVQRVRSLTELLQNRREPSDDAPESLPVPQDNREFLSVKTDHMVSLVRFENIIYLESMGEYVRIHTADGKTLTTLYRLKNMEAALPADSFMRVHRSYIVNLHRIAGYAKGRIFFSSDERDFVPIGENYRDAFAAYAEKTYNAL